MQGNPPTSNCASQAELIDAGKNLNERTNPNRTQWVQATLLWNAILTEDSKQVSTLQNFVQNAPWKDIESGDGAIPNAPLGFMTTIGDYQYDLAKQVVVEVAATFVKLGQPTSDQISRVGTDALSTLDRMYTFAQGELSARLFLDFSHFLLFQPHRTNSSMHSKLIGPQPCNRTHKTSTISVQLSAYPRSYCHLMHLRGRYLVFTRTTHHRHSLHPSLVIQAFRPCNFSN